MLLVFARRLLREGPDSGLPTHRPDLLDRTFRNLGKEYPEHLQVIPVGYAAVSALRQELRGERFEFG
jgi:hypothetical protein